MKKVITRGAKVFHRLFTCSLFQGLRFWGMVEEQIDVNVERFAVGALQIVLDGDVATQPKGMSHPHQTEVEALVGVEDQVVLGHGHRNGYLEGLGLLHAHPLLTNFSYSSSV